MKVKLERIRDVLNGHTNILIIPHNDPDPDAIAAAVGFQHLIAEISNVKAQIRYRGIIGRAENKALVDYLKHPLDKLNQHNLLQDLPIALIDTQPGAGNNPLTNTNNVRIVIDHHNWRETSSQVQFVDVRPEIGASSTMITEYLQSAKIDFPASLATALFYGIKTDTKGLGRGANQKDSDAYIYLLPKIDVAALVKIEQAQIPPTYFKTLNAAIQGAKIYDQLVISYLGVMKYPDLGAEIADLLMRLEGTKWVICMGVYQKNLVLSIRSRSRRFGAGDFAQKIVGNLGVAGGHGTMAGGQIELNQQDPTLLADQIAKTALQYLNYNHSLDGKPLI